MIFWLVLVACQRLSPAGRWGGFQPDLITHHKSNQGPWGGYRYLHWTSDDPIILSRHNVLTYANRIGWVVADSLVLSDEQQKTWQFAVPFTYEDGSDSSNYGSYFPAHINHPEVLYRCRTGWIKVEPGNFSSTELNGYILFCMSGTAIAVYHVWGE